MNCRRVRKLLIEYVDGELEGKRLEDVRAHLGECFECSELASKLELSKRALANLEPAAMPEETTARILASLRSAEKPRGRTFGEFMRSPAAIAAGAALAAVLIAVVVVVGVQPWRSEEAGDTSTSYTLEETEDAAKTAAPESARDAGTMESTPLAAPLEQEEQGYEEGDFEPEPLVIASDTDYDESSLRDRFENLAVRKQFAQAYTALDAVLLGQDYFVDVEQEFAEIGGEPRLLSLMLNYITKGEPNWIPYYVEKARFKGKEAWIIGVCGPSTGREDASLSRSQVWVMDPELFLENPEGGAVHIDMFNE